MVISLLNATTARPALCVLLCISLSSSTVDETVLVEDEEDLDETLVFYLSAFLTIAMVVVSDVILLLDGGVSVVMARMGLIAL